MLIAGVGSASPARPRSWLAGWPRAILRPARVGRTLHDSSTRDDDRIRPFCQNMREMGLAKYSSATRRRFLNVVGALRRCRLLPLVAEVAVAVEGAGGPRARFIGTPPAPVPDPPPAPLAAGRFPLAIEPGRRLSGGQKRKRFSISRPDAVVHSVADSNRTPGADRRHGGAWLYRHRILPAPLSGERPCSARWGGQRSLFEAAGRQRMGRLPGLWKLRQRGARFHATGRALLVQTSMPSSIPRPLET